MQGLGNFKHSGLLQKCGFHFIQCCLQCFKCVGKFVHVQSPKRCSRVRAAAASGPMQSPPRSKNKECALGSEGFWKAAFSSSLSTPRLFRVAQVFLPYPVAPYPVCADTSPMELSSYERDFQVARELRTLQENTDPENLIPATRHRIAANDRLVHASPGRPPAGALTIAQVWSSCLQ